MPDESPRVFLSYGVRDASQIAERLHCDLAARGFEIWQDVKRLRAGRPWDEDVPEGLRTSQVVLALLSPHSVRHALDAGNSTATDSVCLDEIAYARGVRKIPIVPVQVVSCEAPFLVYRLHQIDFRHWRESEATWLNSNKGTKCEIGFYLRPFWSWSSALFATPKTVSLWSVLGV